MKFIADIKHETGQAVLVQNEAGIESWIPNAWILSIGPARPDGKHSVLIRTWAKELVAEKFK